MTEKNMTEIAERLRKRRAELDISYQELASRTGMSKSTLQRYECGTIRNIPLARLNALAQALDVPVSWLVGSEGTLDTQLSGVEFALFGEVRELTEQQKRDVLQFAQFIKNKKNDAEQN